MNARHALIGLLIVGVGVALFCGLSAAENTPLAPVPIQLAPVPSIAKVADMDSRTPITTKDLLRRIQALENRVAALETAQPVGKLIGGTPDKPAAKSPYPVQQH
jgi:hypothetical protein